MMLYDYKQLPELRFMRTLHDRGNDSYVDYEKFILDKSLSPHMYQNDRMAGFLKSMQRLVAVLFDQFNEVKNFKNYMVDKYHYKQKG